MGAAVSLSRPRGGDEMATRGPLARFPSLSFLARLLLYLLLTSMPAREPASFMLIPRFPQFSTSMGWPSRRVANHVHV